MYYTALVICTSVTFAVDVIVYIRHCPITLICPNSFTTRWLAAAWHKSHKECTGTTGTCGRHGL